MKQTYLIDAKTEGLSIRNFIKKNFDQLSTRDIEQLLSQNGCLLNQNIERFGSKKLNRGDELIVFPKFLEKSAQQKVSILYEDDYILAIDKPATLASHPTDLQKILQQKVFLVHRLDKQTSGVLLLAKTKEAQHKLEQLFFNREISKQYLALVHGRIASKEGEIESPMRLKKRYQGGVLYQCARFGKSAHTLWKKIHASKQASLLSLTPITGRTHQLRVHLESIGHPILGDPQYGKEVTCRAHAPRLMLHAKKIVFKHPFLHKKVEIIAPIPIIISQAIAKYVRKNKKCAY